MQAFKYNLFTSTSNMPVQLVLVLNRWLSTNRFRFIFYESEQGGLPQEGVCSPVGTNRIIWMGEIHGCSLNRG
jgi:hypothetical protein